MKEKPIIFSTPMVQALLNTRPNAWPAERIDPGKPFKSMTRRVMKPQPEPESGGESEFDSSFWSWKDCKWIECGLGFPESGIGDYAPYKVGDVLWVRETWSTMPYGRCNDGSVNLEYAYKADGSLGNFPGVTIAKNLDKWKPSIFMPRKAARLFLEVKSARVERLQDISLNDVVSEGIPAETDIRNPDPGTHESINNWNLEYARHLYKELWDSLNAKRGYSWESNPWVWVYEFMRVEK